MDRMIIMIDNKYQDGLGLWGAWGGEWFFKKVENEEIEEPNRTLRENSLEEKDKGWIGELITISC